MDPFIRLLERLGDESRRGEPSEWPAAQLDWMSEAGVLGWLIPAEYGGTDIDDERLVDGYQQLAAACLTSTFVLTQRNAAIQRIVRSENTAYKADVLPQLVTSELFATVGISHLTTSRQHCAQPAVTAEFLDGGFILRGEVPWVSGADRADVIVTGGTLEDGRQVLLAVETCSTGITVREPAPLMALDASRTASVVLDNVFVPITHRLHGPVEQVMKQGGGGAGALTTSALALGHAASGIQLLADEAERRPELIPVHAAFADEHASVAADLSCAVCHTGVDVPCELTPESLRQRANSLALRTSQACLAATKGAGFVVGHPASRLVSEAMFFLVWSCPQSVVMANLRELVHHT